MHRVPQIVFIAEDDIEDFEIFEEVISDIQPEKAITLARDGGEMMNKLIANGIIPSIIILDLNMPKKNGIETLKEIKGIDALKDVPVVILTTSNDAGQIEETFKLGANYFISKPADYIYYKKVIGKVFTTDYSLPITRENFYIGPSHQ